MNKPAEAGLLSRAEAAAGRAPGRPKPARIPSGDRPMYSSGEGLSSHLLRHSFMKALRSSPLVALAFGSALQAFIFSC